MASSQDFLAPGGRNTTTLAVFRENGRNAAGFAGPVPFAPLFADGSPPPPTALRQLQPRATLSPARAVVYERFVAKSVVRFTRGQAFQPGHGMSNRLAMAQSTVAIRHWRP